MNSIEITFEKPKVCYECDEKRKTGKKFYCERCNEWHFVCKDCVDDYLEYERIENPVTTKPLSREENSKFSQYPTNQNSEYAINQYSESSIKEFQ